MARPREAWKSKAFGHNETSEAQALKIGNNNHTFTASTLLEDTLHIILPRTIGGEAPTGPLIHSLTVSMTARSSKANRNT